MNSPPSNAGSSCHREWKDEAAEEEEESKEYDQQQFMKINSNLKLSCSAANRGRTTIKSIAFLYSWLAVLFFTSQNVEHRISRVACSGNKNQIPQTQVLLLLHSDTHPEGGWTRGVGEEEEKIGCHFHVMNRVPPFKLLFPSQPLLSWGGLPLPHASCLWFQ